MSSLTESPTELKPLQHSKLRQRSRLDAVVAPLLTVVVLISLWQIISWASPLREDLFPGPLAVAQKLPQLLSDGSLLSAVGTSLFRAISGFAIAVVVATPVALLLAHQPLLRKGVGPLVSAMQVLPSIAWVPAAIILFGLSDATIYTVLLLGAIPSIINGLLAGIDMIPAQYKALSKVLGASKWEHVMHIELPAAMPGYVAGLRQGWAFAWRSLMAAELIAVGGSLALGVGSLLQRGRDLADLPLVMLVILTILLVGVLIELVFFAPIERKLLRDRGMSRTGDNNG
ncbi:MULTISPECIES: ABC transporter permease [Glutamicibacter]|uniref:ABC transporter permease n=1 Tax=Glutamicibacter halophytocola TaxID=1933880 RepID=A0A5B8HZG9_9MICC|nr:MULTISPECIES: ABC transporter permease [Glutamicibacter]ALG29200.1 sulfate ABC transporter permease [Glutamicibacter halophytocola]MBF6673619.1 ABC transporter permease [Glutamicibacter sp. FBE19]NQD39182.1 ABC transporter permease [Glutamicibacter halophytocola]QDY65459.1 ABC transporter permease [Glutamicibacter halophytocola]UUX57555.1 ABC transporter permease [Glutamicibacter halophytocola]